MPHLTDQRLARLEHSLQDSVQGCRHDAAASRLLMEHLTWRDASRPAVAPAHVVAVVAADGGNIELSLKPYNVCFVRIASSERTEPLAELFFSSRTDPSQLAKDLRRFNPECMESLARAGVDVASEISGGRSRGRVQVNAVREILEWGALLHEARRPHPAPAIIVRDGLLRSIALSSDAMKWIGAALHEALHETGNEVVGIAKSIPGGLDFMSVLLVSGVLDRRRNAGALAYLVVDRRVEEEMLPPSYRADRALGTLALVSEHGRSSLVPIEVLGRLRDDLDVPVAALFMGRDWYPAPGYPVELSVAHEHARVTEFEVDFFRASFCQLVRDLEPDQAHLMRFVELTGLGDAEIGRPVHS